MFTIMRQVYAEKKKIRFLSKIRDFGIFSVWLSWTYISGFVVIDSGFMASGTFFASNVEGTSQKTCGV